MFSECENATELFSADGDRAEPNWDPSRGRRANGTAETRALSKAGRSSARLVGTREAWKGSRCDVLRFLETPAFYHTGTEFWERSLVDPRPPRAVVFLLKFCFNKTNDSKTNLTKST